MLDVHSLLRMRKSAWSSFWLALCFGHEVKVAKPHFTPSLQNFLHFPTRLSTILVIRDLRQATLASVKALDKSCKLHRIYLALVPT